MSTNKLALAAMGLVSSFITASFTNWDKLFPDGFKPSLLGVASSASSISSIDLTGYWKSENSSLDEVPWIIRKDGDGIQLQSGHPRDNPNTWYRYDPIPNQPNTYQRQNSSRRLWTIVAKSNNSFTLSTRTGFKQFYRIDRAVEVSK